MSAVKQALAKLDNAVATLEGSMNGLEGKVSAMKEAARRPAATNGNGQVDMFDSQGDKKIDGAAVAARLDQAIEKVESLLEEA